MKAVITGIQGFVGGHLAQHLLASGDEVLGCSRRTDWSDEAPADLIETVQLVTWNLAEHQSLPSEVVELVEGFAPDCIYHLAALSVPEDCGRDHPTPAAWATNVAGTEALVELATRLRHRPRILFVSSSHVYAAPPAEHPVVAEDAPLAPRSAYGQTKLAGEELVLQRAADSAIDAIVARAFQHTGPRQDGRMMLPSWARQFLQDDRQAIEIYTRDAGIDLTDVRDVVRAYRGLIERGASGEVYNVGSGVNRTSGEVLDRLVEQADPGRRVVELWPGHRQDPIADISRLQQTTGWRPEFPLDVTVRDTLEDWRQRLSRRPGGQA